MGLFDARVSARIQRWSPDASEAILWSFGDLPTIDRLESIDVPALILRGGEEGRIRDGSLEIAQVLPRAEVITIRNGAHDPWLDDPDQFFESVRQFLMGPAIVK
jgi:pimeloyl-ACP methyl ester carboxylesterase